MEKRDFIIHNIQNIVFYPLVCIFGNTFVLKYRKTTSYKKQELLTFREFSPWWGPCCSSFQLFVLSYYVSLCNESCVVIPLRFPNKNNVRFVFISNGLQEGSCLIYVICVCLHIVVYNTYCVVFLFCLFSSCVPYVVNFSELSIFDYSFCILCILFHRKLKMILADIYWQ